MSVSVQSPLGMPLSVNSGGGRTRGGMGFSVAAACTLDTDAFSAFDRGARESQSSRLTRDVLARDDMAGAG